MFRDNIMNEIGGEREGGGGVKGLGFNLEFPLRRSHIYAWIYVIHLFP